jgi:hypothetical protein
MDAAHRPNFVAVLEVRLKTIDAPAKARRVEKVLKSLGKLSR